MTKTKTETAPSPDPGASVREILERPERERAAEARAVEERAERVAQAQLVKHGEALKARLAPLEQTLKTCFVPRPPVAAERTRLLSPALNEAVDRVVANGGDLDARVRILGAVRAHLAALKAPLGRAQLEGIADAFIQMERDLDHLEADLLSWGDLAARLDAEHRPGESTKQHLDWFAHIAAATGATR
jgi:hypothetical protein